MRTWIRDRGLLLANLGLFVVFFQRGSAESKPVARPTRRDRRLTDPTMGADLGSLLNPDRRISEVPDPVSNIAGNEIVRVLQRRLRQPPQLSANRDGTTSTPAAVFPPGRPQA